MEIEQQLSAALAPREPGAGPMAVVMARLSGTARVTDGARRKRSWPILVGTLMAVAAAASMLVVQLAANPSGPPPLVASIPAPGAAVAAIAEPEAMQRPAPQPAAPPPAVPAVELRPAVPPIKPFILHVEPLQNDSTDAAGRAAVDTFHRTLLDELRVVPGLILVADAGESPQQPPADYRLTIRGAGPTPGNKFTIYMHADAVGRFRMPIQLSGDIAPACAGTGAQCGDPVSMAAVFLDLLRKRVFPSDPLQQERLQAQLRDAKLDPTARLNALIGLQTLQSSARVPGGGSADREALRSPLTIRGAIELAGSADPDRRAEVWRTMRGIRSDEFVQPLVASLQENHERVRVEAATSLAMDYATNEQAREALRIAARDDALPMVRALAQLGLAGESTWNSYVAASLKDEKLSDAARIEPLFHTLNQVGKTPTLSQLLGDEAAIQAMTEVVPRAVRALPGGEMRMIVLLSRLSGLDHPAIPGMLLDSLASSRDLAVRQQLVQQLSRHGAIPAVRAEIERLSKADADPRVRDMAAKALKADEEPGSP